VDTLEYIPIWRAPHRFVRFAEGVPRYSVTFGLLCLRLGEVRDASGVREQGEELGYEWLAATADRLRGEPCSLSRFLVTEFGLRAGESTVAERGEVPADLIEQFVKEEGPRIADWAIAAFGGLGYQLPELARSRQPVPWREHLHAALNTLNGLTPPAPLRIRELSGSAEETYLSTGYTDLVERAAIEFVDLVTLRPRVKLCRRCGRPFVPTSTRGETGCPNNIWDAFSGEAIARCRETDFDSNHTRQRDRERRRLHQRWKRAVARHGSDDPAAIDAENRWLAWKAANPPERPRGRPETPSAQPDIHVPEKEDQ
jgi:hypothetical protein